jgi:O-antigen/teichoic acid export membrane protein
VADLRKILKHSTNLSLYLLSSVITSILGIIINPFLAANLSPHDYAVLGYFLSFNLLISPIISFSLLSYYSRNYFKIKEENRQEVIDTLLVTQVIMGLAGLLLALCGFYLYFEITEVNFPFYPFALLCFVPIFFTCFYNFLLVDIRMKRQALKYLKITVTYALSGVLFALLFVVILKRGATGRLWSILIPAVGIGIYSFKKLFSKIQFNKKILKDAIQFGWPISISAILYYFLSGVDRAMLERLNDATTFGNYNVAMQISGYLYLFYAALNQTFEPDIYRSISENKIKKLTVIVIMIAVLTAIPTIIFIIFAEPVIRILTYGRYMAATGFAQVLALKNIPMAFCFLISNVIIGFGYPKVELVNRIAGAVLSIIAFRLLIMKYGFYGAAVGNSVSYIIMTIISSLFIIYKLNPFKIIRERRS